MKDNEVRKSMSKNVGSQLRGLSFALTLVSMACGGGGDDPLDMDASDSSVLPDGGGLGCDIEFGETYVLDLLEVVDSNDESRADIGKDFDGDGVVDNHLGWLSGFVNPGWVDAFEQGHTIMMIDILWEDPQAPRTPGNHAMVIYIGIDADNPANPANNLSGEGTFLVPAEQFDISCEPTSGVGQATFDNSVLSGSTPASYLVDPSLGTIELTDMQIDITLSEDGQAGVGEVGALWTVCGLAGTLFPGSTEGTVLEFVVGNAPTEELRQADIDRDGDGLETVILHTTGPNAGRVEKCIDGNGDEVLGNDCGCDSRIQDAYSTAFYATVVPAEILGIVQPN